MAFNGMSWNLFTRIFSNGVQLIIYFLLARLLNPTDFGVIAIILVFVNISNIFAIAGLGAAIIQNTDYNKEKFDTIYILSSSLGILICTILYFSAPFIGLLYSTEFDLVFLIRISTPLVIFNSINSIQISILQRDLDFKKMFYVTSIPLFFSGIASIVLAYFGFGIYSLILNNFLGSIISIVICFSFYVPIPSLTFNINHAISSLNYSYKILITALLDELNKSFFTLSIGKYYSNSTLGNYNLGRQIPSFASATLNATISSVFFPFYAKRKSINVNNANIYRKVSRVLNFIVLPCISIVILVSSDFVRIFFTEKWIGSVFYLNMFSVILGLHHLHTKITYYINAMGHSNVTLKYELIKKIIGVVVLLITIPFSVKAIVVGQLVVAFVSIIIMFYPTKKYLAIDYWDQLSDFMPLVLINGLIFFIVYVFGSYINIGNFSLLIYPVIYFVLYFLSAFVLRLNSLNDIILLKDNFNFK
ncbi:lipopolysaccharide biosynthesis protein [Aquirufa sp. KTFRIE-69F]|uniref:Lipopolysaccharide biosynthesis protein n=1 Tax=Aquirufa originis TaxID=3096514 RepID=A0ABW6DA61_9BACT